MTAVAERNFTLIRGSDDGSKLTLADDVAAYLQFKRKKLTAASRRGYVAALQALVDYFPPDTTINVFEGPTAAQRVLEATGNLKAAQALLGHSSSATTDAYVGWSTENLEASMRKVLNV